MVSNRQIAAEPSGGTSSSAHVHCGERRPALAGDRRCRARRPSVEGSEPLCKSEPPVAGLLECRLRLGAQCRCGHALPNSALEGLIRCAVASVDIDLVAHLHGAPRWMHRRHSRSIGHKRAEPHHEKGGGKARAPSRENKRTCGDGLAHSHARSTESAQIHRASGHNDRARGSCYPDKRALWGARSLARSPPTSRPRPPSLSDSTDLSLVS